MPVPPVHAKNGSVLLVTLLVVSLLTAVVLSFTAYVRVELRNVSTLQDAQLARAQARLGLDLALAQLQQAAGPDTRATATAAILGAGAHEQSRFYTGVWNTRDASAPPVWLVSGAPSISSAPSDPVLLVGEGSLGGSSSNADQVRVPRVHVPAARPNAPAGSYAFWIGDEGVKASLAIANGLNDAAAPAATGLHSTELERLRFAVPGRNAGEHAFLNPPDLDAPEVGRLVLLEQFAHMGSGDDPRRAGGIHHFTLNARGLLTHPLNGGVKTDLSMAPETLGSGFAQFMNFPAYMQAPAPGNFLIRSESDLRRMHRITPPSNLNPAPGEIVHSVVPIITDFGLQFSPRARSTAASSPDYRAQVSMRFAVEFWNPFTTALPAEDLILEISGLQPITVFIGETWSHTFDIPGMFGDPLVIRLNRQQYHTSPNPSLDPLSFDSLAHGAGRLLYWITPDLERTPPNTASFSSNNPTQTILTLPVEPGVLFPADPDAAVRYRMDETPLSITLRKAPENGGEILSVYNDFIFDDVDTGSVNSLRNWTLRWLTYRFRIIERGTTFAGTGSPNNSLWLKFVDKRTPRPRFGFDVNTDTHTIHESTLGPAPDDSFIIRDLHLRQDQDVFIFDRVLSSTPRNTDSRRDISLFELPRQPLISIGQLQHLHIHGMPPYSVGNPWGGQTWNRLFDDYFLSGMQPGISVPDFDQGTPPPVPHPRLRFADMERNGMAPPSQSDLTALAGDSAVLLEVNGHFNLNSVSPRAWKAILGANKFNGLIHPMRNLNLYGAAQVSESEIVNDHINYPAGFTRFPQSFHELFDLELSALVRRVFSSSGSGAALRITTENNRVLATFKQTVNFLADRTTLVLSQLHNDSRDYSSSTDSVRLEILAQELAQAIQQRNENQGRPFFSVSEFLTEPIDLEGTSILEGVLEQNNIRRVYIPVGSSITVSDPEERTPGWLSQADILSALAPFLSTRSDTFVIRSYGDVRDAQSGAVRSKAWVEAVVQRTILPVGEPVSLAEMAEEPASPFGRQFRILSFRWLDESEI